MRNRFEHVCDARCYGDEVLDTIPEQRTVAVETSDDADELFELARSGEIRIHTLARGKPGKSLWIATISETKPREPKQKELKL